MPDDRIPPVPKIIDYPSAVGIGLAIVFTALLLVITDKFDKTGGVLTISLLIVVAFLGLVTFSVFFALPTDELTSTIVGGLIAAFATVIAHWISKSGKE